MQEKPLPESDLDSTTLTAQSSHDQKTHITGNLANAQTVLDSDSSFKSSPETTNVELDVGSIIKDTFQIVAKLGEGGMGTVFKAINLDWKAAEARNPNVALKILKPEFSANKDLYQSLHREFERSKRLAGCENIVEVYDFSRARPHVYMAMEFLEGKTIAEHLQKVGAIPMSEAWPIIRSIGNALAYAHEKDIVHRDIKPGNIMITTDDVIKVLDFGIASKINENENDKTKVSGHNLGALTVPYASPEMLISRPLMPDARDDIYAFACVVYEILTGKKFYNQLISTVGDHCPRGINKTEWIASNGEAFYEQVLKTPIQRLDSRQTAALKKALAYNRGQRTTSIKEFLNDFRPNSGTEENSRRKYLLFAGAGLAVIGLGWWMFSGTPEKPVPKPLPENPVIAAPTVVTPKPVPIITVPDPTPVPTPPPVVSPPVAVTTPPVIEKTVVEKPAELSYKGTSSDDVIQLRTSQPSYKAGKHGDPFHVFFKLSQPKYIRLIDFDANKNEYVLRPSKTQSDKLLDAGIEYETPPKNETLLLDGLACCTSIVTLVAGDNPIPKNVLNKDGSVSEKIKSGGYSWVQVKYTLE